MVSILNRRNWLTRLFPARRQRRAPAAPRKRHAPGVEVLEDRTVPSATATLSNIPAWVGQGPSPAANGNNVEGIGGLSPNPQVGAVESIAIDPTNASHAYIGTVNGGVWVTNNLFASEPTWTPLTDAFESLAISSVAISPVSTSTLYAGTGSISSVFGSITGGQGSGGGAIGLLKSIDGGTTWVQVSAQPGATDLNGMRIRDVVPTTQNGGQTVLLGMLDGNGLLRSTNGGFTFGAVVGIPAGATIDKIFGDPTTAGRFYAGLSGTGPGTDGVYISNNFGATWTRVVDANLQANLDAGEDRVEVTVGPTGDVWAAVLFNGQMQTNGGANSGVFRSTNQGATWTAFTAPIDDGSGGGLFPGGQGNLHFSMVADPFNPNVIYVGGDRQPIAPNPFSGTTTFSGRHFLGDIAANTWTTLEGTIGANGTAPHPDSRDMVFVTDPGTGLPNIIEADDGGIYRLSDPEGFVTPLFTAWSSANGTLANTEFYSVSYDSVSHTIFGGAQDNGSPAQNSQGSAAWTSINVGDGTYTAVDNTTLAALHESIRYTTPPGLGGIGQVGGSFLRQVFDANGNPVGAPVALAGRVTNLGNVALSLVSPFGFDNPYVLNSIDPKRMLVGSSVSGAIYESTDQGDDFVAVRGNFISPGGRVSALAYGGTANGVANPDVALVGTDNAGGGGFFLLLQTVAAGPFSPVLAYATAGGATPSSIVFDPTNWHTVYVTDVNGKVWQGTNVGLPGTAFTNITANLGTLITAPTGNNGYLAPAGLGTGPFAPQNVTSVQVVKNGPSTEVLVGAFGGVFRAAPAGAATVWTEYGTLPHVLVSSLVYNAKDNVLVAGTLGRGAFTMANVTSTVFSAGSLNIRSDTTANVRIVHDHNNPLLLDVFLNNPGPTPNLQVERAALSAINVGSLGTGSSLTLDETADRLQENPTVTGTQVTGLFFTDAGQPNSLGGVPIPVSYVGTGLALLTVDGGNGGNTITVAGTSAVATTINDSLFPPVSNAFLPFVPPPPPAVANSVTVTGKANDLSGLAGKVTINAGPSGADSITFNDSGRTAADHITLTATSLASAAAPSGINYGGAFSQINVQTPNVGNSIISVQGAPPFVDTEVFLGGFNNTVQVSVKSSSGYNLHLHSLGFGNKLTATNVTGPVVVKHPNPFEFDFLYALQVPFFTSQIFWDGGFSSATSSPAPS